MLGVDFRRMFKSKLFYILIACALVMPILMTVMMSMMDGSVSVNPQTGEETVMQGSENTWQNIGTLPGEPLGSTIINVALCAVGGTLFAFGLGAIRKVVLKKTRLV